MCCRSEWQERMYIYKWHEVDQTKHEIFCVHIVCNEIQVKVNLELTTFFFYLRFPYCPNFFWFGVVIQIAIWTSVCWILKTQKDGLKRNPACSVSLGMFEWRRRGFVNYTNTEAHVNSQWFSASASHDMTTWTYRLWESLHENFTASFEKTSIISYCTHTETSRQPVKIKVRFNM